jgi:hypothetical protein
VIYADWNRPTVRMRPQRLQGGAEGTAGSSLIRPSTNRWTGRSFFCNKGLYYLHYIDLKTVTCKVARHTQQLARMMQYLDYQKRLFARLRGNFQASPEQSTLRRFYKELKRED